MIRFSQALTRGLTIVVFAYLLLAGATYNGLLSFREWSIALIILTVFAWLTLRLFNRWLWRATALDGVILLWLFAIIVSLLVNHEAWRRIAIGLWFVFAYIGVWYLIHDLLANRALRREYVVDMLLMAGVFILFFGYIQLRDYLINQLPLMMSGLVSFELPRPVSTLGNPNALGAFLVVLIPFLVSRVVSSRRWIRRLMMVYLLLALILLFLSYSRGAWGALFAAVVVQLLLLLSAHDLIAPRQIRSWWTARSRANRLGLIAAAVIVLAAATLAGFLVLRSLGQSGRSLDQRTGIYHAAVTLFTEQPLVGHGLFTFGAGLARLESMPPERPHSHAHDIPLQVAAELGLIGLAALAFTLYAAAKAMRQNWQAAGRRDRIALTGAIAAILAFGLHQLIDVPAMMPSVALSGLVALVLAAAPMTTIQPITILRCRLQGASIVILWLALLVTGIWSTIQFAHYNDALTYGLTSDDYGGAAKRLQPIIDADPSLAITPLEQGYFYGLAANNGDTDALSRAIDDYQRFTAAEPSYAFGWANLGALQWQADHKMFATLALSRAVDLAPEAWPLAYLLGQYREALGDQGQAFAAYRQAVTVMPDVILLPGWSDSSVRVEAATNTTPSEMGQLLRLIDSGQTDIARDLWARHTDWASSPRAAEVFTLDAIFAIERGELDSAKKSVQEAGQAALERKDEVWVNVGTARLAYARGDMAGTVKALADARAALTPGPYDVDYVEGVNIIYIQYLHQAVPRMFLPQVQYPLVIPATTYLVDMTARLIEH